MNKSNKQKVLKKYWADSAATRIEPDGPSTWEDLMGWWKKEENKIKWKEGWGKRITSELSCSGMCFFFYIPDDMGPWLEEEIVWMQAWLELPKKFAEDYCLYINDPKQVTAIAHKSIVKEFQDHTLLAGGAWYGLESTTSKDVAVTDGKSPSKPLDDKLLLSLGEKFGDKNFTEAEFIQHAMSFAREELPTA